MGSATFVTVVTLLTALLAAVPAWSAESPTLDESVAAIEHASKEPDGDRVVVGHISRELRMAAGTLRAERATTGVRWGDVLIANRLSQASGLPFEAIVAEFQTGKTWEDVARAHGVNVEQLINDVLRSQAAIENRSEDKPARPDLNRPLPPAPGGGGLNRGRR